MATRIIEYGGTGRLGPSYAVVPADQYIVSQTPITATGTSAQSSAVSAGTGVVLVQSDEAVYVAIGANPTATTSDYRIQAGQEQYFSIVPGASMKVAVRT
jgi:hypothetical protein